MPTMTYLQVRIKGHRFIRYFQRCKFHHQVLQNLYVNDEFFVAGD